MKNGFIKQCCNYKIFFFIPGIVTRCPLELRMKTRREKNDDQENLGWKGRIRYNPSSDLDDESGVDELFDDPEEVESRVTQGNE